MADLKLNVVATWDNRLGGASREISNMFRPIRQQQGALTRSGTALSGLFAGIYRQIALIGGGYLGWQGTIGAAIGFESAMADLFKVVDATPGVMNLLNDEILNISKRMPVAASSLAAIAAEAAQAGIEIGSLGEFTEFAAKAAVAFGMEADLTGERFAKIRNVYQLTQDGLEGVADATNHLSNNMAAKAPEILNFINRASGAAGPLNLTAQEIAAMGSSLIALGVIPETAARGLTAFSNKIVKGGPTIERAFKSIGLTFRDWLKLQREDGPEAMVQLFEALGDDPDGAKALIDLIGQDFSDDFSKLMANPALLREAFGLIGDEAEYASSVLKEYGNRADTAANKMATLGNNLKALGIELSSGLLGPIGDTAVAITELLQTMDQRATLLDQASAAWKGFTTGLGLEELKSVKELLDTVFGEPEGDEAAGERLGRLFVEAEQWGQRLRPVVDTLKDLRQELHSLSPTGGNIMDALGLGAGAYAGYKVLRHPIKTLTFPLRVLGGVLGGVAAELGTIAGSGGAATTIGNVGNAASKAFPLVSKLAGPLSVIGSTIAAINALGVSGRRQFDSDGIGHLEERVGAPRDTYEQSLFLDYEKAIEGGLQVGKGIERLTQALQDYRMARATGEIDDTTLKAMVDAAIARHPQLAPPTERRTVIDQVREEFWGTEPFHSPDQAYPERFMDFNVLEPSHSGPDSGLGFPMPPEKPEGPQDVSILNEPLTMAPAGVVDVHMTNPPPAPVINQSISVQVSTNADPGAIGDQVADRVGAATAAALRGAYTDS